jgi:thioredoxin-dependent peroxiredoxin
MAKKLKPGISAPAFCLKNEDEQEVCLKGHKGKWIILYFYPKDDTPGCTIEAKDFSKENPGFEELDAVILGVSADDCGSHKSFINKYKLKINLLADPDKKTLKKYGVWEKKKFMGREYMGIARTTYLINPGGKIAWLWEKVIPAGHAREVRLKIEELREVK